MAGGSVLMGGDLPPKAAGEELLQRAVSLFTFLQEYTQLRTTTTYRISDYETVIWLSSVSEIPGCQLSLDEGARDQEIWMVVRKPRIKGHPKPPPELAEWIDAQSLPDFRADLPNLFEAIRDLRGGVSDEGEPIWLTLNDHPDIRSSFDNYVESTWWPWVEERRIAEKQQDVYTKLFQLHQSQQRLGEEFEVVLGVGLLTWELSAGATVMRHLVVAETDVQFDANRGVVTVTAGSDGARPSLEEDMLEPEQRPEIRASEDVRELLRNIGDDMLTDPAVHQALTIWVQAASAKGQYDPAIEPPKKPLEDPTVTFAPALILRKRGDRSILRAIKDIKEQLTGAQDVPSTIVQLISIAEGGSRSADDQSTMVPGTEDAADSPILFPLPANDDQREIVSRLRGSAGVLVQGPPGTGKSHTIANVVSHFLAQGKRVLVTSHTARALEVLRAKIPQEIRELAVVALGADVDSRQELERSVNGITRRLADWDRNEIGQISEIEDAGKRLSEAQEMEQRLILQLRAIRERDSYRHTDLFDGFYRGTAQEIAFQASRETATFEWLTDSVEPDQNPPLSDAEATELLTLTRRRELPSETERQLGLPESGALPDPALLAARVHEEARAAVKYGELAKWQQHLAYPALREAPADLRNSLDAALRTVRNHAMFTVNQPHGDWAITARNEILAGRGTRWRELQRQTENSLGVLTPLASECSQLEVTGLDDTPLPSGLIQAQVLHSHLQSGHKVGVGLFRSAALKQANHIIKNVRVDGLSCREAETVSRLIDWLRCSTELARLDSSWGGFLPAPTSTLATRTAFYRDVSADLGRILELGDARDKTNRIVASIAGYPEPMWSSATALDELLETEQATRCAEAKERTDAFFSDIERILDELLIYGSRHELALQLLHAVQARDVNEFSGQYALLKELESYRALADQRDTLRSRLVEGAPALAAALTSDPENPAWDERLSVFTRAWHHAQAMSWLTLIGDPSELERIELALDDTRTKVETATKALCASRAWRHALSRITENERQNLMAWVDTVKKIGKGTGKHAPRLRREARAHMQECRSAVPAWIMPIFRVAEAVDMSARAFDVVIIDEASQSGPEALFLYYLAEKVIVVGDQEQIAPDNIGVDRNRVQALNQRYLGNVHLGGMFDADRSLFDHAKIRFRDRVPLREHFRCMPEIIAFSNRLCYDNDLIPLKQFAGGRLSPTINVVHVPGGFVDDRNVNEVEAEALVARLEGCLEDPAYDEKTFGVISLVGDPQAKHIGRLIASRIGVEAMEQRRIVCGDAYAFQGDERDVMLLSLVQAPNKRPGALTAERDRRRFNVAASRAREQAWLFHTATLNDLHPEGMAYKLLDYYSNPTMPYGAVDGLDVSTIRLAASQRTNRQDPPQPFDSWFEVDVFLTLVDRGYRVLPQYPIGGYHIDLLVEGWARRLAVECDGDRYHGDERFAQDTYRQRQLMRCGMRFVRIRGSTFYRDREAALQRLWATLQEMEIQPHGAKPQGGSPAPPLDPAVRPGPEPSEEAVAREDQSPPETRSDPDSPAHTAISANSPSGMRLGVADGVSPGSQTPLHPPTAREPEPGPRTQPYRSWSMKPLPPIPSTDRETIAKGLVEITRIEGPVVCERLFQLYVKSSGGQRVRSLVRQRLLECLRIAVRKGWLAIEDELGNPRDKLAHVVRVAGSPAAVLRERGDRDFDHVPPSEIALRLAAIKAASPGLTREQVRRELLTELHLKRLTGPTRARLDSIDRAPDLPFDGRGGT